MSDPSHEKTQKTLQDLDRLTYAELAKYYQLGNASLTAIEQGDIEVIKKPIDKGGFSRINPFLMPYVLGLIVRLKPALDDWTMEALQPDAFEAIRAEIESVRGETSVRGCALLDALIQIVTVLDERREVLFNENRRLESQLAAYKERKS